MSNSVTTGAFTAAPGSAAKRRRHLILLMAAVAAAATGCGAGERETASPGSAPAPAPSAVAANLSGQDRGWLRRIHRDGIAEIQVARLAQSKAKSEEVRALGELLLTERGKLDQELLRSASQLGLTLPNEMSKVRTKQTEALAEANRGRFDRRFVTELLRSHKQAIAATRRQINRGTAPEVVALARTTLPSLRTHLGMLRKADDS
jgi:putative membrane protein